MHFASAFLILLALFIQTCTSQVAAPYYVNQANPATSPDGSLINPFNSLEQAVQTLGAGTFELVLLGPRVGLTSILTIPLASNYIIRANDTIVGARGYFPLNLQRGASIAISGGTTLTLQNIQVVELDRQRASAAPAINMTSGRLTLNHVLVSGISYTANNYVFLSSTRDTTAAELIMQDSTFRSLTNFEISLSSTRLTIFNCTFSDITQTTGMFLALDDNNNLIPNVDISLRNILIENSDLNYSGDETPTAFMGFYMSTANIAFQDITLRNLDLDSGTYLFQVINGEESLSSPTSFGLQNINIQDVSEVETASETTGSAILFDLFGASRLTATNLVVSNVQLRYKALLSYTPNTPTGLPVANVNGVTIQSSKNANLLFSTLDTLNLQGVRLQNNTFGVESNFPQFSFTSVTNVNVRNVYSTSNFGPIFRALQGPNQRFENCTFEQHTTSQTLPSSFQYIVSVTRKAADPKVRPVQQPVTLFRQFNVNGFTDINDLDITRTSNDSYIFMVTSEKGDVIIQDSRWSNLETGGFLSVTIVSLQINGLIADADPSIPQAQIPWHRLFQIVNVGEINARNCVFINHKNLNIFNLYNIRRSELYNSGVLPTVNFDNITVRDNDVISGGINKRYVGLVSITSPLRAVKFTMSNSRFINNKISSGLIIAQESSRVDITLTNNLFDNNFAQDTGTVLTMRDMQDEYSDLQMRGNRFTNNLCPGIGGVFAFISAKLRIDARDNTYTNNSVGTAGGVGYVFRAKTYYSEFNGLNHAGLTGGDWHFNVGQFDRDLSIPFNFTNSVFTSSSSGSRGGAFYIISGTLNLDNSFFSGSRALTSGGDVQLLAKATLTANRVTFRNSSAAAGAVLFAETLVQQNLLIQNSQILNTRTDTSLVKVNTGSFRMLNTQVNFITGPLFDIDAPLVEFIGDSIKNINCTGADFFCVLQGSFSTFNFLNSELRDIVSPQDLIVLNSLPQDVNITNLVAYKIRQTSNTIVPDRQVFILRATVANVVIQGSTFDNLFDFTVVSSVGSNLTVSNSRFSRTTAPYPPRLLQTPDRRVSQIAQYLLLESSSVLVEDSEFEMRGGFRNGVNGGAIGITGNGGTYTILRSDFEGNQAINGGAVSVTGSVGEFNVLDSIFRRNTADQNGGAIYFAPTSMGRPALINDTEFGLNRARDGGAVYISNPSIQVTNSRFRSNNALNGNGAITLGGQISGLDTSTNVFISNLNLNRTEA